jgi:hypothetical protein
MQLLGRKTVIRNIGHTVAQEVLPHAVTLVPRSKLNRNACRDPNKFDQKPEYEDLAGMSVFPGLNVEESIYPVFGEIEKSEQLFFTYCVSYRSPIDRRIHTTNSIYTVWRVDEHNNPITLFWGPTKKPEQIKIRLSLDTSGIQAN